MSTMNAFPEIVIELEDSDDVSSPPSPPQSVGAKWMESLSLAAGHEESGA